ncbi:unnamed protein product [Arabis nemorensis]|uniref:Uncharacterized protein n=1 Tax=Arabis nemorensis TaxID=586526 RepID=A0A565CPS3_9BRAS|nr:unnamed protein product [Arabis nemorensis]
MFRVVSLHLLFQPKEYKPKDETPEAPVVMIPHKTKRGAATLARLKIYEGVPPPYEKVKRMVILDSLKSLVWFRPDALKLQSGHKFLLIGPSIILRCLRQRDKKEIP